MKKEEKKNIPFYRTATSTGKNISQIPLGLTIVKNIVDSHEGKIVVESKPGEGTTIKLYFKEILSKKILLIEDDPAICLSLTDILESEHYDISNVRDGSDGLTMAVYENFDLILLDQMLPTMNGIDVCRALRQKNIDIPIIMLTSKNDEATKILAFEIGADDYITKPFSINELLARVKAVLRR